MKKPMFVLAAVLLLTGSIFNSCKISTSKVEDAQNNVQDAKDNLVQANNELYQARKDSILQFKKGSEERISNNEKIIAAFKAKITNEKKEDKAAYEKNLALLEKKNSELKKKLEEYTDEGKEKWDTFKTEFGHDMDDLENSLKNFTVKNEN